MTDEQQTRTTPTSGIDFNFMVVNSVWGQQEVPQELRDRLNEYGLKNEGQTITEKSLWGLFGYFTRDMRLGNLDFEEAYYCKYMLELAGDCLREEKGYIKSFMSALSRSATVLELSQSKKGFLRRIMNTLRQEQTYQELEPPKKGFFGSTKNNKQGGL